MFTNVRRGKFTFFDKKFSKSPEYYHLDPGIYPSITVFVEAMNTPTQERHNHNEDSITTKVSWSLQSVEIYLTNERSVFVIFCMDLRHIFGSNVGNEFGLMLRCKGPHKPEIAHDIVRSLSHDIHGPDWVQYRWWYERSIPAMLSFFSEAQGWRHYNYWTWLELSDIWQPAIQTDAQNFFSQCSNWLEIQKRWKNPLFLPVPLVFFSCLEKPATYFSNLKAVTRWLLQDKLRFYSIYVLFDNVGRVSVLLYKLLGELQFYFCINVSPQLQNALVLTCWNLLRQKL